MAIYSVFEHPNQDQDLVARAERLSFVKEGFCWPALFFSWLWLLYHWMWLEALIFIGLLMTLEWLLGLSSFGQATGGLFTLGLMLLLALEANGLRRAKLVRRGWVPIGWAVGRNREEAEVHFFHQWLPRQVRVEGKADREIRAAAAGLGSPPHSPQHSSHPDSAAAVPQDGEEIIGSFPRA